MHFSSCLTVLVFCVVTAGCASTNKTRIEVSQQIAVDCGVEPLVDQLRLLPHPPIGYVDEAGVPWVKFSVKSYENMSENAVRVESRFDQDVTVIRHYRDCIEKFNAPSTDPVIEVSG